MKTFRIIGPPGTGKTTYVAQQCAAAARRYSPDKVMVLSLTRAAAAEARGATDQARCSTIHSAAFWGLNSPSVVEGRHIKVWNDLHPTLAMSGADTSSDVAPVYSADGDKLMASLDLKRARMTPRELWNRRLVYFADEWTKFKKEHEIVDFTDLIENAIRTVTAAPGDPAVILVDEVQDTSALELKLIAKWAEHCESLVLVGDPHQSLYHWRGADESILIGQDIFKVLDRSYRVPERVHAVALRLLRKMKGGKEIAYEPREGVEGRVTRPGLRLSDFPMLERSMKLGDESSVMVLATCAYMLAPVVKHLRSEGIPYHNPFARDRWSPLGRVSTDLFDDDGEKRKQTSTIDRLLALISTSPEAIGEDYASEVLDRESVLKFAPMLRSGVVRRGVKKQLMNLGENLTQHDVTMTLKYGLREQDAAVLLEGRVTPEWVRESVTAQWQKALEFPLRVLERRGAGALVDEPSVVVGTIHSVKGGEAETVVLSPDLSPAGHRTRRRPGWHGVDAVRRTLYVGVTRARDHLVLLEPENPGGIVL